MAHKIASDENTYGGSWSILKLDCVSRYLESYLKVFKNQTWVTNLWYIDAFSGDGLQGIKHKVADFEGIDSENEVKEFIEGSALRALQIAQTSDNNNEATFGHFVFNELNLEKLNTLKLRIKQSYKEQFHKCSFINKDANEALPDILKDIDWDTDRAICFIDPCATQLNWNTLKAFEGTKADVWILFPIEAVIRMLPRENLPSDAWSRRLDTIFGDKGWRDIYYDPTEYQPQLFAFGNETLKRRKGCEDILVYLKSRFETIFPSVSDPGVLRTKRNTPIFALYALIANESLRAQNAAMRIAKNLIDGINSKD